MTFPFFIYKEKNNISVLN